ncbi:TPA: hypothetical protein PFE28_004512, partial [Kluyvera cryocrescens]|nr:hypothetical protein [Kluyvera cryocrescens]
MAEPTSTRVSLADALNKIQQTQAQHEAAKKQADEQESNSLVTLQRDVKTRSALTIWFLAGFFAMIAGCFFFTLWYNSNAVQWIVELHNAGLPDEAKNITLLELDKVLAVVIG